MAASPVTFKRGEPLMVNYTPTADVAGGAVVIINGVPLITHLPIAADQLGAVGYPSGNGTYLFPKATGAITALAPVYWDEDGSPVSGTALSGALTATSSGNVFAGFAAIAAASGDATVEVVFFQATTVSNSGPSSNAIADPGTAAAIPVTTSGYVPIVTAGSETRTLAAPSFIGQELTIYVKTDGGTVVITVASAINQTGNNTITMAEVRDVIVLRAIESGASKVWMVMANDGAALSTV